MGGWTRPQTLGVTQPVQAFDVSDRILLRLLHITLAAQLLLSTVGLAVDAHYCMGELVDMRFFAKADSCGMEARSLSVGSNSLSVSKTPCCQDETSFYKYEPTKEQQGNLALPTAAIAALPVRVPTAFAKTRPTGPVRGVDNYYRPPPLERAVRQALLQAYLI